jgi:hypothetical protein
MPREVPNPNPHVETRFSIKWQRTYTLKAFRNGTYEVWLGDKLVERIADPTFNIGIAGRKFPSNALQQQAIEGARVWIETSAAPE